MNAECPDVLLVDDDPAMRRLLKKWISPEGYNVHCVSDGQEAIETIESQCPHILVSDWEMPRMDGVQLCRWLRTQDLPHYVYVLFVTAHCSSDQIIRGLEAGADDFLRKPVDRGELLARLRSGRRVLDLESRLNLIANTDSLTGLLTQRSFYEQARQEWQRSTRYHVPLSCIMVDVDFFKRINDTLGHSVGDQVIRSVGEVLRQNTRTSDIVCRYGGEEFCVLLPETSEADAFIWADRVRTAIESHKIHAHDKEISITASLGVAQRLRGTLKPEDMIELADQALLVAKQSGRNRVISNQTVVGTQALDASHDQTPKLFEIPARDAMTTIVAGLSSEALVGHAADYFLRFRVSSAPVVDDEGKLVGILSEKDVMSVMLSPNWETMKVNEIHKTNVVSYEESTPVYVIYDFLCRSSIRGVVIVDKGRPTGLISRTALLRWATNMHAFTNPESATAVAPATSAENQVAAARDPHSLTVENLIRTAEALAHETSHLIDQIRSGETDLVPCVVGEATRMQELVNDLLACSRHANTDGHQLSVASNSTLN